MNKSDYLLKKANQLKSEKQGRPVCHECYRPRAACLCESITPFSTHVHFRILMHPLEAKRNQVGTGRLANKSLQNCELITGVNFDNNDQINTLISDSNNQVFLLYPSSDAINISEEQLDTNKAKRLYIFILDSTWACSRKMLRLSPNLQKLPKISFTPNYLSQFSIKRQPKKYCLSTIESVYRVIQELQKQGIETLGNEIEMLPRTLEQIVAFQQNCAEERISKKESNSTCLL